MLKQISDDQMQVDPARPSDTANSRGWPRLRAFGCWASGSTIFEAWVDPAADAKVARKAKEKRDTKEKRKLRNSHVLDSNCSNIAK